MYEITLTLLANFQPTTDKVVYKLAGFVAAPAQIVSSQVLRPRTSSSWGENNSMQLTAELLAHVYDLLGLYARSSRVNTWK